jgi:hypothetical protein
MAVKQKNALSQKNSLSGALRGVRETQKKTPPPNKQGDEVYVLGFYAVT